VQGWTKAEAKAEEVKLTGKSKSAKSGVAHLNYLRLMRCRL